MTHGAGRPGASGDDLPALDALRTQFARMREANEIDDVGEGVLRRHFDERAQSLGAELTDLVREYERRAAETGEAEAHQWLSDAAEALGRRDRDHTRRVLDTVVEEPAT